MHPEAYEGFGWMVREAEVDPTRPLTILDIGGQNVNGSVHEHFTNATITTLDLENADIIADARYWEPDDQYDVVIATEVFEHVQDWRMILITMQKALHPGGVLLATCASTDRPAHGATGAPLPVAGEWYRNVPPQDLADALRLLFKESRVHYRYPPGDAYMWARR